MPEPEPFLCLTPETDEVFALDIHPPISYCLDIKFTVAPGVAYA